MHFASRLLQEVLAFLVSSWCPRDMDGYLDTISHWMKHLLEGHRLPGKSAIMCAYAVHTNTLWLKAPKAQKMAEV